MMSQTLPPIILGLFYCIFLHCTAVGSLCEQMECERMEKGGVGPLYHSDYDLPRVMLI